MKRRGRAVNAALLIATLSAIRLNQTSSLGGEGAGAQGARSYGFGSTALFLVLCEASAAVRLLPARAVSVEEEGGSGVWGCAEGIFRKPDCGIRRWQSVASMSEFVDDVET